MDNETGDFRGYVHVDFTDSFSFTMALKLDREIVCGTPARIRCAVPLKTAQDCTTSVPTTTKTAPATTEASPTTAETAISIAGRPLLLVLMKMAGSTYATADSPKKPTAPTNTETALATTENVDTNRGSTFVVSDGKIKRRTCYECGEKGHISSGCPKNQTAGPTNATAN